MVREPAGRLLLAALLVLVTAAAATAAEPARRVITLAPHLAELVFDAGAGDRLVGVIAHSDHPPAVRALPRIGDAFALNREAIVALEPDLVLAWEGFTPPVRVRLLREDGHRVVVLGADRPEAVADALLEIGRLTGTEGEARVRADAFRDRLAELRERYAGRTGVRVFVQLSTQPLYTVSDRQMIGQVVRLCGGRNVFGEGAGLTPMVGPEAVVAADPEVVLATDGDPAGDPFALWRGFPTMAATAHGRLFRLTADWITRPSLRLADGAEEACRRIDAARTGP